MIFVNALAIIMSRIPGEEA